MTEAQNRIRGHQFPVDPSGRKNLSLAGVGPGKCLDLCSWALFLKNTLLDGVYCHVVQMRGLPFRASEEDIRTFFHPTVISACQFEFGYDSRPSGRASVAFPSHNDAIKAMEKDKQTIGSLISNYDIFHKNFQKKVS